MEKWLAVSAGQKFPLAPEKRPQRPPGFVVSTHEHQNVGKEDRRRRFRRRSRRYKVAVLPAPSTRTHGAMDAEGSGERFGRFGQQETVVGEDVACHGLSP